MKVEKPTPKHPVPEWAKHAVWYQIFPERFRNGDLTNDPPISAQKGAYPDDLREPWQIHPWGSDWYELQPYELANKQSLNFNILRRRYGGDLQGIIDKLDYLQDLGITAIYLNPIFWSPSHHKYDGLMYHHVDPYFGPDPEGDIELMKKEIPHDPSTWQWTSADRLALKLISEVHQRNMHIIFDGVWNHMSHVGFAFEDVKKNQQQSPYKNWFEITSWKDEKLGKEFSYNGWWGVKELPEIREDSVLGLAIEPRNYIYEATKRWMSPDGMQKNGIDGWRLDVAFCIDHQFWKDWSKVVKSIHPQAYLTAEVIDPIPVLVPYLQGDEFDAVMNYNFAFISSAWMIHKKTKISVSEFDRQLRELRHAFPDPVAYVQQNLFDSHDTNRLPSAIVNRDVGVYGNWGDYFGKSKAENPNYLTRKPTEKEYKIQKLFVALQMTYIGAPMIYYGTEVGMWGANDPDSRKPMVWDDIQYDDEVFDHFGNKKKTGDKVSVNQDLYSYYKQWISIRNSHPALRIGDFKTIFIDDSHDVYGFSRKDNNETLLIFLNNSESEQTISGDFLSGQWKNLISKEIISNSLTLESISGVVLLKL